MKSIRSIFRDEDGITTISMAIAIFISVALIFTSAQVYKINSASAEIQEVADVCAMAAENEVAEFVVATNVCDATLLSMTLLSGALYGIGLVAACIPPAATVSEKLIELASKTLDMRERAYESMTQKLNAIQDWLPFLASANALCVARANNDGALAANYLVVAELVPATGESLVAESADELLEVGQDIEDNIDDIRDKAKDADEAAKFAEEAKLRAFNADCGQEPGYCMSERARSLASLSDIENPVYSSVDAWNFEVALKRIKAYYKKRLSNWTLSGSNVEQRADSVLRKRFYQYASQEMASAYIHDTDEFFDANLPSLYRNTDGLRTTFLYTESIYPITQSGDTMQMHAWSGCPNASGATRLGSISELDSGGFTTCTECQFSVSSLGKVAAVSTSASNGFEHYYQEFREAVVEYQAKRTISDSASQEVKDEVLPLLEFIRDALSDAISKRIEAQPPGRDGCVAMVVNLSVNSADSGFENIFVSSGQTLGSRAAVSGALIVADDTQEGESSISTILSKLSLQGGFLGGAAGIAGSLWTGLLKAYESGQDALLDAVENGLNSFSTSTSSGLGVWAKSALVSLIESIGLQPSDIRSKKPVLVNTSRVVQFDTGAFAVKFREAKLQGINSSTSSGLISGVASKVSGGIENSISTIKLDVCEIELPFMNEPYKIEWTLPDQISSATGGAIEQALTSICGAVESIVGARVWQ